jgi:sulfoacetaldehyde dehydrogenase
VIDTNDTGVAQTVRRAREAQAAIADYSQEQVDELVTAVAWSVVRKDRAEALAQVAVDEGSFGNYADKVVKINRRVLGVLADLRSLRTVGVVEEDSQRGLVKIAKPVGVVAALIPTTGPDATPPVKTLFALKGRNAIVVAPHPRTKTATAAVVGYMREACEQVGAPADLVQVLGEPSMGATQELMRLADLVVATGGAGMVQAAYSSGTPAYGVGVGNAVHVVDETADLDDAASAIATAKTFDYATSCLADNAVVAEARIYDDLVRRLVALGGHVCSAEEKQALQRAMWPDGGAIPAPAVIAKSAPTIAELAGFTVPADCRFLVVEEDGVGPEHPFSGEKLCPVLAFYHVPDFAAATALAARILEYQGAGHSVGLHTRKPERALALGHALPVCRVIVNQAHCFATGGSFDNALPFSLSMGCGTWGGNSISDNLNYRHFLNITRVVHPLAAARVREPTEDELFGDYRRRHRV